MASPFRVGTTMTLEKFLKLPEQKPVLEYIDGQIEAKVSPQHKHGLLTWKLLEHLNGFVVPSGLGLALPELRCTFAGRSIVPDVVFLLQGHFGSDEQGEIANEKFVSPDLHVEILSPDQSPRRSREKLEHSTAHGCPLGWLIDPERKVVEVYRPGRPPERLGADGALEGEPVLPGYRLPVSELFGWLRVPPFGRAAGGIDPA